MIKIIVVILCLSIYSKTFISVKKVRDLMIFLIFIWYIHKFGILLFTEERNNVIIKIIVSLCFNMLHA